MSQNDGTRLTVLVTADVYDMFRDLLHREGGDRIEWIRVNFSKRPSDFLSLLEKAACVIAKGDLTDKEYQQAPHLKLLQLPIAGYEAVDLDRARRLGVAVANNGGANAISVAEHVFLLILALQRNLLVQYNSVVDGTWKCLKHRNLELAGKALGIVGLGRIGKEVAIRAQAFGMRVRYNDIRRAPEFETRYGVEPAEFPALMRDSDIVTFHVPLTSKTRLMINRESLGWMKEGGVLVNTSRGEILDEEALCETLAAGRLLGACLDVFQKEPLPRDSGLLRFNNVVLTPHTGPSRESYFRMIENVLGNVLRLTRGEEPLHTVTDYEEAEADSSEFEQLPGLDR